jgi:photosystem II stability/assembly factor-like uncharacterized protein
MARGERRARPGRPGTELHQGPRKVRAPGRPEPRFSNHKRRAVWFQSRSTWPLREPPVGRLVEERSSARAEIPVAPGRREWKMVGPSNIGGRMTCVACHPADPDVLWAGAAGGGVWYTDDGGRTWASQWHREESLNVGALAIDPAAPWTLYCGTGEANLSADSYPGVGLYRTRDGGKTWRLLAGSARAGIPTRIGAIAIDPFDPRHLLLGGVGHQPDDRDPSTLGGLWSSRDGGKTWRRETFLGRGNHWCHSIAFHPATRGRIFAAFTERGARSGLWRSEDGGKSWHHLTKGLPAPESMERAALAIAPSDPAIVYALVASVTDHVRGVFRSADGGERWKEIGGRHFGTEAQMRYGNTIAVHPTDPDHVLCGGVDLHLTRNAGKTWTRVTRWDANRKSRREAKHYAHADHHALAMPAGRPGLVYDLNDGGMDVSEDGGRSWTNRSDGLAATMFYDVDVAQSDGRMFGGGAQDNGTVITLDGEPDSFFMISGGDGGWMVIDPTDRDHLFTSSFHARVDRFRRGHRWKKVSPPEKSPQSFWMVFLDLDPTDPDTVFVGTSRVWRSPDDGETWKDVSGVLDGSAITAIDVGRADPRRIHAGTENGGLFRSLDGGATWSSNLASASLPGFAITRIESHPEDADVLYATVGNFGTRHVFRSADAGRTWKNLDQGKLPAVPFHAVVVPKDAPRTVYVACDAGIFVSRDEGRTWRNFTFNLPNVTFVDLVHHEKDGTLTTATYGRSLWRIQI